jgi:sedoheptulokinase
MRNSISKCILGIDFGTSKIAAVLIDLETKEIIYSRSKTTNSYIINENPLKREQDIKKIRDVFISCIEEITDNSDREIVSLGLTGQMHGIMGLNSHGVPVTNFVTWQDERGNEVVKNGQTLLGEMDERGGKRPIASGYGIVTLYDWLTKARIRDISKICTLPDYFGMELTGKNRPVMDHSMAHSIGSFDLDAAAWDFNYISRLGIDQNYFPDIVLPTTVTGELNSGLFPGFRRNKAVPVSVAIGDNQASFIGSVKDYMDTILINIGTGSQISFVIENLDRIVSTDADSFNINDQENIYINHYDVDVRPFVEKSYLIAGSALSGGCVYDTLKTFFLKTAEELFGVASTDGIWDKMEHAAMKETDMEGLMVYPLFAGKRSNPEARGSIAGLSAANFTPSKLIYATLEGIAKILKDMIADPIIKNKKYLYGSGNGLRKNVPLQKVISSMFQKELFIPQHEEEAALGAAINGAVASGIIKSFSEFHHV